MSWQRYARFPDWKTQGYVIKDWCLPCISVTGYTSGQDKINPQRFAWLMPSKQWNKGCCIVSKVRPNLISKSN